jgi:hypothetical protein
MLAIRCNEASLPDSLAEHIGINTDSQALMSGWEKAERTHPCFNRKWDGLFRQALQDWAPPDIIKIKFTKVKAHTSIKKATSEEAKRDILGNFAADRAAAWCMDSHAHPAHGEKATIDAKRGFRRLKSLLQAIDSSRTELGVPPKPPKGTAAWVKACRVHKEHHNIAWQGKGYACTQCMRRFGKLPPPGHECNGAPLAVRGIISTATALGHSMQLFLMAGLKPDLLTACTSCGAYATQRSRLLASKCTASIATRGNAISKLIDKAHPTCINSWVESNFQLKVWQTGCAASGIGPVKQAAKPSPSGDSPSPSGAQGATCCTTGQVPPIAHCGLGVSGGLVLPAAAAGPLDWDCPEGIPFEEDEEVWHAQAVHDFFVGHFAEDG